MKRVATSKRVKRKIKKKNQVMISLNKQKEKKIKKEMMLMI